MVGVLVVVAVGIWWRRSPAAAGSVLSLAGAFLCASISTEWAGDQNPLVSPLQSGLVFWLFAAVVAATAWLVPVPSVGGNRAVTTVWGHAILIAASPFVVVAPAAAPILGFCAAMAVVVWRTRMRGVRDGPSAGRRGGGRRHDASVGVDRAAQVRGVDLTRDLLWGSLGDEWRILEGCRLPDRRVLELLAIGPPGVFAFEARNWPGEVELIDVSADVPADVTPDVSGEVDAEPDADADAVADAGGGAAREPTRAYALDGDARGLAIRLQTAAGAVRHVADRLRLSPTAVFGVIVFWGDTTLPDGRVDLTVVGGGSPVDGTTMVLVRGDLLTDWLRTQPTRLTNRQVQRLTRRAVRAIPS